MEAIKSWLTNDKNRKTVPFDEMQIVLHEQLCNTVGIRGSNVFTITYSVVANVSTYKTIKKCLNLNRNNIGL